MKRTPPPDQHPPVRLTAEERAYFEAVEAHFIRLRGRPLILSPRELERTAGWHREGIPLRIVRRGIDRYFAKRFDRPAARQRAVSLEYCEDFVRQAWQESLDLAVGGNQGTPPGEERGRGETDQTLQRLMEGLERSRASLAPEHGDLALALDQARGALAVLCGRTDENLTVQSLEAELEQLDREVTEELLRTAGPEMHQRLREACYAEMKETAAGMDTALYNSTLERLTMRRLRHTFDIPEISLFAL